MFGVLMLLERHAVAEPLHAFLASEDVAVERAQLALYGVIAAIGAVAVRRAGASIVLDHAAALDAISAKAFSTARQLSKRGTVLPFFHRVHIERSISAARRTSAILTPALRADASNALISSAVVMNRIMQHQCTIRKH
jgi:hypothetical protein